MLSGETGKTIFECQRFTSFLSFVNLFRLKSFSIFCGRSATPIDLLHHSENSATLALLRAVTDPGLGGENDHPCPSRLKTLAYLIFLKNLVNFEL